MSEPNSIFTALAELSTRQIAETTEAVGMPANKKAAKTGGSIAQRARVELESKTGRKVVTGENYCHLNWRTNARKRSAHPLCKRPD